MDSETSVHVSDLAQWLYEGQLEFFRRLIRAALSELPEIEGLPPLDMNEEEFAQLSLHSYCVQLAITMFTFEPTFDSTDELCSWGRRINLSNRDSHLRAFNSLDQRLSCDEGDEVSTGYVYSPEGDFVLALGGCVLDFEEYVLPLVSLYHGAIHSIDSIPTDGMLGEAVAFAHKQVAEMRTSNPLAYAVSLSYFSAFKRALPMQASNTEYSSDVAYMMGWAPALLRTWRPWCDHLVHFQRNLLAFVGDRSIEVD